MYGNNDYRDYLEHAGNWTSHKYILKIGKGAAARYFYTQEEINAFRQKAAPKLKKAGETYEKVAKGVAKKYGPELTRSVERHKAIGRSLKRTVTGSGKKQAESGKTRTAEKRAQLKNQKRAADNERRIQKEAYAKGERNREKAFQLQNQKAARKANQKVTDKARRAYKRDRFIEDVKGDIARTGKSVSKSVNKAKKAAKQKWDISAPARAIRKAEYKSKKKAENKSAVNQRPFRIRYSGVSGTDYTKKKGSQTYEKRTLNSKATTSNNTTVAREFEKRDQLARKAETRKADQKYQKKNQKRIAKESKRKARRKKVKRVINSVLRRG